jgi:hypothetical protein
MSPQFLTGIPFNVFAEKQRFTSPVPTITAATFSSLRYHLLRLMTATSSVKIAALFLTNSSRCLEHLKLLFTVFVWSLDPIELYMEFNSGIQSSGRTDFLHEECQKINLHKTCEI